MPRKTAALAKAAPRKAKTKSDSSERYFADQYLEQFMIPAMSQFVYGNTIYPIGSQTMLGASKTREVSRSLSNYMAVLMKSPPAFAAQMVRALVLSQARFTFRYKTSTSTPRKQFGTPALAALERPWTNATTGELINRVEWDAGVAGNAFVTNFTPGRLRVLRPDWTAIIYGSSLEPEDPMGALDGEVIGYVYQNGGFSASNSLQARTLRADEVAHWSPLPDPLSPGLGMSWLTPALRDIQGDNMMIEHKIKFFENGATPNLVMKGIPAATPTQFNEWIDAFERDHIGIKNAYRTIYATVGMDATVVGSNLSELDFASTGGYSETRISFLSRVPAALLGISAGLKGSSLNAGNYAETRRTFTDTWVYPTLQDLCMALAPLVDVPPYAELWYDTTDMPILRDDAQVAAEIVKTQSETVTGLITVGFTPDSVVAAVRGQDLTLLKHDPRFISVQLQALGAPAAPELTQQPQMGNGKPTTGKPMPTGMRALDDLESKPNVTINVTVPPIPAPVLNVPQPIINMTVDTPIMQVPKPEIHMDAPVVNIEAPQVTALDSQQLIDGIGEKVNSAISERGDIEVVYDQKDPNKVSGVRRKRKEK